jgi:hypothetical protein
LTNNLIKDVDVCNTVATLHDRYLLTRQITAAAIERLMHML